MIIGRESAFDTKYREEGLFKQICDFRGNGEIIGATRIDESLLDEIRKSEALIIAEKEIIKESNNLEPLIDRAEESVQKDISTTILESKEGQLSLSEWEVE